VEERGMFSYKGHRRFEKVRKSGRLYKQYKDKEKILFVFRESMIVNCWRFETKYEKLDGLPAHQTFARGTGPVVRHLCSDNRCINPLHLVRGTDYENAKDEIEVRDFENELMMEILEDRSMEGEDKALIHLTLLPKVSIKLIDERGYNSLGETNKYLREFFRKRYVEKLTYTPELIEYQIAERTLNELKSRSDISIVIMPGR
jgi:hypothetical protein